MRSEIIERSGNYYVAKCDAFYAAYSGYEHIVCHQPPTICQPKQLAGFGPGRVDDAKAFMRERAAAGDEDKRFARTKARVTGNLKAGMLPVPHDDPELRRHLIARGYTLRTRDRIYEWYAPPTAPEPTLFDVIK